MIGIVACLSSALALAAPQEDEVVALVPEGFEVEEGTTRFSADGRLVAYVIEGEDGYHPVIGEAIGEAFDIVERPEIDPAGEHVYFRTASQNKKGKVEYTLLRDDKEIASGGWIGPIALNEDGVPAYWMFEDLIDEGKCQLFFGKKKSKSWLTGDMDMPPFFTPDGKTAISIATRGGDWSILWMSSRGKVKKRESPMLLNLELHPTGKELALTLWAREHERYFDMKKFCVSRVSGDGKDTIARLGTSYGSAGSPVFSPSGARLAYKVLDEKGKLGVAVDDQEDAPTPYVFVDELTFAPNDETVAYVACLSGKLEYPLNFGLTVMLGVAVLPGVSADGSKWVVRAGDWTSAEVQGAHSLTWSPDGSALAYAAKKDGDWHLVIGDTLYDPCDEISALQWSENGESVLYGCRVGRELIWRQVAPER